MEIHCKNVALFLTVTVFITHCLLAEAPEVYTAPTVRVWTRGNIHLPCHFEEEPLAVFWVKESSSNQQLETRKASFFDGYFASKSERFDIDENYSLVISDVHVEDEGSYYCQLVLGSFEVFLNSTFLSVNSPAVDTLPTIQGWRGEDIRLPCEFHEEPLAVYWVKESMLHPELSTSKAFFDGDYVSMAARFDIDRNFNLIITDLEVADEGLYHCQVVLRNYENFENSTLMTVSSMALTHEIEECVEETQQDPSRCTHQTPSETSYFNLSCVVSGFRPNISMLWTEESGEKLYSVVSQQKTLADNTYERFETITVSAKLGAEQTFKCTATGDSLNGRSTTEITVLPISATIITHGMEECVHENRVNPDRCTHQTPSGTSSFNLTCVVSGFMSNISMLWTEGSGEVLYPVLSQQTALSSDTYERFETITVSAKLGAEQTFKCTAAGDSLNGRSTTEITVLPISAMIITDGMEECVHESKLNPDRCTHRTPSETSSFNLTCVVSGFKSKISMLWTEESGEVLYPVLSQQTTLSSDTYERFETITVSAKHGTEQTFKCTATGDSLNETSTAEIIVLPLSGKSVNLGLAIGLGMGISVFLVIAFLLVGKYLQKYHPDYLPRKGCGWNPCWRRQHETERSDAEEELIQMNSLQRKRDDLRRKIRDYLPGMAGLFGRHVKTQSKVNIGVFGEIGAGKSSLIKSLIFALNSKGKYPVITDEGYTEQAGGKTHHILTERIELIETCGITEFSSETVDRLGDQLNGTFRINGTTPVKRKEEECHCAVFVYHHRPDRREDALRFIKDFCRIVYYRRGGSYYNWYYGYRNITDPPFLDLYLPVIVVTNKNEYADAKAVGRDVCSFIPYWCRPTILMFENYTQGNNEEDVEKDIEYLEFLWEALKRCDWMLRYR